MSREHNHTKGECTMPVLCHYNDCQYFGTGRCKHPRKKENGGQFILPVFSPGKTCIWGKQKFDPTNFIRAQLAVAEHNRRTERNRLAPIPQLCGPSCSYWIYLSRKSATDYTAICDHPDRKGQGLPEGQVCRIAVPINYPYTD